MTNQPWLSVITPVYNGEKYLSFALDSIVAQHDNGIECIIVDGESTDATLSIIDGYREKVPIRVLKRESTDNWVTKTNYALTLANGEYACFLHHDDLWFDGRLNALKPLVRQFPQAVMLLHASHFIDGSGKVLGLWSCPLPPAPRIIKSHKMVETLLVQNFISILAPIFKRETAVAVGGLDENLWYTADWDFWLKIAARGDTLYLPKPLSGFRIHSGSQTVTRSSYLQDFRGQLDLVAGRHMALWPASERQKSKLRKIVDYSNEVNTALAGTFHHSKPDVYRLVIGFLELGPVGGYQYLEASRIWQRASARLKARLISSS